MEKSRFSPALVVAILALVVALSGTAMAAKNYVITSKSQIAPKVLRALKGTQGQGGQPGAAGGTGAAGKDGTNGLQGSARAYVKFDLAGTILLSKNVEAVTPKSPVRFCVKFSGGITPANSLVVATADSAGVANVMLESGTDDPCPSTDEFLLKVSTQGESVTQAIMAMVP